MKEKKKQTEEKQASTSKDFSAKQKLDEMSNLMKHLASKMSKLEVENKPVARPPPDGLNRNPMPFRRPFHYSRFFKEKGEIWMIREFNPL